MIELDVMEPVARCRGWGSPAFLVKKKATPDLQKDEFLKNRHYATGKPSTAHLLCCIDDDEALSKRCFDYATHVAKRGDVITVLYVRDADREFKSAATPRTSPRPSTSRVRSCFASFSASSSSRVKCSVIVQSLGKRPSLLIRSTSALPTRKVACCCAAARSLGVSASYGREKTYTNVARFARPALG